MATESTKEKIGHDPEIVFLCEQVRETSFAIHRFLRHGHLEKVYENALAHRLRLLDLKAEQQRPLAVCDEDGTLLGDFYADLLINGKLVVELKACDRLADEHTAQVLGYLRASRLEHAMLINFGSPVIQFKKFILNSLS
ncbi:MAG: GxxExxY protein [Verrucomicrobiota bacterium]|nr:GxxExxY protein [Verrucomicrobiota bacterium]